MAGVIATAGVALLLALGLGSSAAARVGDPDDDAGDVGIFVTIDELDPCLIGAPSCPRLRDGDDSEAESPPATRTAQQPARGAADTPTEADTSTDAEPEQSTDAETDKDTSGDSDTSAETSTSSALQLPLAAAIVLVGIGAGVFALMRRRGRRAQM